MRPPPLLATHRATAVGLGILLVLGLLGGTVWWWRHRSLPPRVILVMPVQGPDWPGFKPGQAFALRELLLMDLEATLPAVVIRREQIPSPDQMRILKGPSWILSLAATRTGSSLGLECSMIPGEDFAQGKTKVEVLRLEPQSPRLALAWLRRLLPLNVHPTRSEGLYPPEDEQFWTLLEVVRLRRHTWPGLQESSRLAEHLALGAPQSLLGGLMHADTTYRVHMNNPRGQSQQLATTEARFAKVLQQAPWLPEAAFQSSQMLADAGRHAEALKILQEALLESPHTASLWSALCYSSRTAGLLDLAKGAWKRHGELVPDNLEPALVENTLLYLEDFDGFERTLEAQQGHWRTGIAHFYRGYLNLVKGRKDPAIQAFKDCETATLEVMEFDRLARVFRLSLEGKAEEALALLRDLDHHRVGLSVPDGEFTFKLAEAYALLGAQEEAVDLVKRALFQGFTCARWYERSPFLRDLQGLPRFRSLLATVQQRQALLAAKYPPSAFGL